MKENLENLGNWPLSSNDKTYLTDFDFKNVLFFNEYNIMSHLNVYKIKSVQTFILYIFTLINDSSQDISYIIKNALWQYCSLSLLKAMNSVGNNRVCSLS